MEFDTLYKRTKTGAIQYWKIGVGLHDSGHANIFKESGQLGTDNPTHHLEAVTKGKNIGKANETTPFEQAISQAESDWEKKRDEGYKSLTDLKLSDTEQMACGMKNGFEAILREKLPQFNTDANGNIKPMLATDCNKVKNITYPCYIQPKLDGVRCLMIVERKGPDLDVTFLSRSGKPYTTLQHIANDVVENAGPEPFILDGEIYSHELTFQEITQAVKKQYPNSLKLHFRAYDIVNDESQKDRMWTAKELVKKLGSNHIHWVDTMHVQNAEEVKNFHDEFVQNGYEGAMLRLFDGVYDQGQRSRHLLKVKKFDETEFTFIRFETGQREEDLIAVCAVTDGRTFKAKVIGTREEKAKLKTIPKNKLEYRKYTVKHFGYTDDSLPRFPIGKSFRDYE